jgi:hypothetical protein
MSQRADRRPGGNPEMIEENPHPAAGEAPWVRLRVELDRDCQAPLLLVSSLMARRALDVRSAVFTTEPSGRMRFHATVRGRGPRVTSVLRSLESRVGITGVEVIPIDKQATESLQ